jgi:hypothetical protein
MRSEERISMGGKDARPSHPLLRRSTADFGLPVRRDKGGIPFPAAPSYQTPFTGLRASGQKGFGGPAIPEGTA